MINQNLTHASAHGTGCNDGDNKPNGTSFTRIGTDGCESLHF
jgi:hypothetical protein